MKHGLIGRGLGDHLNSYSVVLMAIFFLQIQNILPSVEILQSNIDEDLYCGWNVAFNKDFVGENSNRSNVTEFLEEFFRFYSNFPYETHIICPLIGQPVKKYNLKYNFILPNALSKSRNFEMKKDKFDLNKCLVVQDPFELTKNVSRSVSPFKLGIGTLLIHLL